MKVAWVAFLPLLASPAPAQPGPSARRIQSVFVEPFGGKGGAQELRAALIGKLRRSHKVRIVDSSQEADAVIAGSGELWIKGYHSVNPRVRYLNSDSRPVYGGYLSIELKDRRRETLWSYLVTPAKAGSESAAAAMAAQMVRKLVPVLEGGSGAAPSR